MQELAMRQSNVSADLQEKVLLGGDLARLTPAERLSYYNAVCNSVGLNPLTRPFEYLALNGKLVLYARKDCTDQLRDLHGISITIVGREVVDGCYCVTAQGKNMTERTDESIGAVPLPTSPADKANAMMKAETKAKRRVTLSICGLGMLDETEIETIQGAHPIPSAKDTAEDYHKKVIVEPAQRLASVLEPSTAEALSEMDRAKHLDRLQASLDKVPNAAIDAVLKNVPDDLFDQSSAQAEHEVALTECHNTEELQKAWDECVRDKRLTSESRPKLYELMKRIEKGLSAKK